MMLGQGQTQWSALVVGALWIATLSVVSGQGLARWTTGASMPSSRSEVAVATLAGKVYVVGGFAGDIALEIYDPATDRWSRGAPL
ncbi:MAG: hypothetical protein ACREOH_02495, partial [Candidatus Entotheonellia bacterium]